MTLELFPLVGGSPRSSAVISPCGRYRYRLDRRWSEDGGRVCWVMLNPSTADADQDDPTLRRCISYTRQWGHSALTVVNLYAWRATHPRDLPADHRTAVGPDADHHIREACSGADLVVCGWGNSFRYRQPRVQEVMEIMASTGAIPKALKMTNDGAPWHPLYLRSDLIPEPFSARSR